MPAGRKPLTDEERKTRRNARSQAYYEAHKEQRRNAYYENNKERIIKKIETIKTLIKSDCLGK